MVYQKTRWLPPPAACSSVETDGLTTNSAAGVNQEPRGHDRLRQVADHSATGSVKCRTSVGATTIWSGYGLGHVRFLEIRLPARRVVLGAIHLSQRLQVKRLKYVRLRGAR